MCFLAQGRQHTGLCSQCCPGGAGVSLEFSAEIPSVLPVAMAPPSWLHLAAPLAPEGPMPEYGWGCGVCSGVPHLFRAERGVI